MDQVDNAYWSLLACFWVFAGFLDFFVWLFGWFFGFFFGLATS
jgi:hypothetical protein